MSAHGVKGITDMVVTFCLAAGRRLHKGRARLHDILAMRLMDGRRTAGQVGRLLGVKPAGMSRLIRKLISCGMIEVVVDPDDRRKSLLTVTRIGERALADAQRAVGDAVALALHRMPPGTVEALSSVAPAVTEALLQT